MYSHSVNARELRKARSAKIRDEMASRELSQCTFSPQLNEHSLRIAYRSPSPGTRGHVMAKGPEQLSHRDLAVKLRNRAVVVGRERRRTKSLSPAPSDRRQTSQAAALDENDFSLEDLIDQGLHELEQMELDSLIYEELEVVLASPGPDIADRRSQLADDGRTSVVARSREPPDQRDTLSSHGGRRSGESGASWSTNDDGTGVLTVASAVAGAVTDGGSKDKLKHVGPLMQSANHQIESDLDEAKLLSSSFRMIGEQHATSAVEGGRRGTFDDWVNQASSTFAAAAGMSPGQFTVDGSASDPHKRNADDKKSLAVDRLYEAGFNQVISLLHRGVEGFPLWCLKHSVENIDTKCSSAIRCLPLQRARIEAQRQAELKTARAARQFKAREMPSFIRPPMQTTTTVFADTMRASGGVDSPFAPATTGGAGSSSPACRLYEPKGLRTPASLQPYLTKPHPECTFHPRTNFRKATKSTRR